MTHVKGSLFDDLPTLDAYACPHAGCKFQAETSTKMIQHLSRAQHNELLPRVERRLAEVAPDSLEHAQMTQIKAGIKALTKYDQQTSGWPISNELQVQRNYYHSI